MTDTAPWDLDPSFIPLLEALIENDTNQAVVIISGEKLHNGTTFALLSPEQAAVLCGRLAEGHKAIPHYQCQLESWRSVKRLPPDSRKRLTTLKRSLDVLRNQSGAALEIVTRHWPSFNPAAPSDRPSYDHLPGVDAWLKVNLPIIENQVRTLRTKSSAFWTERAKRVKEQTDYAHRVSLSYARDVLHWRTQRPRDRRVLETLATLNRFAALTGDLAKNAFLLSLSCPTLETLMADIPNPDALPLTHADLALMVRNLKDAISSLGAIHNAPQFSYRLVALLTSYLDDAREELQLHASRLDAWSSLRLTPRERHLLNQSIALHTVIADELPAVAYVLDRLKVAVRNSAGRTVSAMG